MKILGVIPARYNSKRLPGKPLREILGIPMIERTYKQSIKSKKLNDILVATDDERILNFCQNNMIPCELTNINSLTGTDRVREISTKIDADFYVNIQGDEPIIDPKAIDTIIDGFYENPGYEIYNLFKKIDDEEIIQSNTIIKTIINENNELVYMSRYPIPFNNSSDKLPYKLQQIPIYGFTKNALNIFSSSKKSLNEKYEDIEILRFLDKGLKVKMLETDATCISVDTEQDIIRVEKYLNQL